MDGLLSLVNSTEYAGLTIKEWNIVQFSKLSRVLAAVVKEYKERNIGWTNFSSILENSDGMAGMSSDLLEFIGPFLEYAPAIITISCNVDQKRLEDVKYTDGTVLVFLILKANLEHLNSFFGKLVAGPVEATTDSTKP